VLSWFGIQWVMSRNVIELLIAWRGGRVGMRRKCVWNMIPLCVIWIIWRERNQRSFEGVEKPLFRIISFLVNSLYSWDKRDCYPSLDQFFDWFELLLPRGSV
jgi:hypothetical protein